MRTRKQALRLAVQAVVEPFRQTPALRTREFSSWLRDRGVTLGPDEIARLAAHGLLLPVAVAIHEPLRSPRFVLATARNGVHLYGDIGRAVQSEKLLRKAPPLPFESDAMLWHPFQLWQLHRVVETLEMPKHITPASALATPNSYAGFVKRIMARNPPNQALAEFANSPQLEEFERVLGFTLAAEPLVPEATRGRVRMRFNGLIEDISAYREWVLASHPQHLLSEADVTVDLLKIWHGNLALWATILDPLRDWRVLARYAPRERRLKLRGDALLAEEGYYVAEVIRRYLEQFADVSDLPEEDTVLSGPPAAAFKERFYGRATTTDGDRSVFRNVVRSFGLDPQPRFRWLVEGVSEIGFIERWAELRGVRLVDRGIELVNLRSVGEVDGERVRTLLEISQAEEVFVTIMVDTDDRADRKRKLTVLAKQNLVPAGWTLFGRDFEEANFTMEELAMAATNLANLDSPQGVCICADDVAKQAAKGDSVWNAVSRAAREAGAQLAKGEKWGRCLADALWQSTDRERPITRVFTSALRADTSNYRFTLLNSEVGPDGTIQPRKEP